MLIRSIHHLLPSTRYYRNYLFNLFAFTDSFVNTIFGLFHAYRRMSSVLQCLSYNVINVVDCYLFMQCRYCTKSLLWISIPYTPFPFYPIVKTFIIRNNIIQWIQYCDWFASGIRADLISQYIYTLAFERLPSQICAKLICGDTLGDQCLIKFNCAILFGIRVLKV